MDIREGLDRTGMTWKRWGTRGWERNDRDLAQGVNVLSLEISLVSSLSHGANVEYSLSKCHILARTQL